MIDISDLRREFTLKALDEGHALPDPLSLFELWLREAIEAGALEPNAMCLSTVANDMRPSSRVVLLKQVGADGLVFFTNYESRKAVELDQNPFCALSFVWHELERQVRIEGEAKRLPPQESDRYFESRPQSSKLGAWASPQSKVVAGREYLETRLRYFDEMYRGKQIPRPGNWGGYIVKPSLFEFWQGRPGRLHDRIRYTLNTSVWDVSRLAP